VSKFLTLVFFPLIPLVGIVASPLTDDQVANLERKKANYYIKIGITSLTKQGWTSAGSFIEQRMMVDWTKSRMQEILLYRMSNSLKLANDNSGLSLIQSDLLSVLQEGVRNGGYAATPAPSVYVPDILDIDQNLRAQGIVSGIKFKARLVVSVTKVIIDGTITI